MGKVICLGIEFNSDDERRKHFRNELRAKLPELKHIEGYPIGEDEDIVNLSDPPYYTACPNPWLNDFIAEWEKEKANFLGRKNDFHVDEPYAGDISEGKNNPVYMAHSYHTKVPHPAIMRYILHYTQPGDIVFDGFAGTGMTGVATTRCNKPENDEKYKIEAEWNKQKNALPNWGKRRAILNDLSPIASFISYNYNVDFNLNSFVEESEKLLIEIDKQIGWLYEIEHTNQTKGIINYTIWSEIFNCPSCNGEVVFWEHAISEDKLEQYESFNCKHCKSVLDKNSLSKAFETVYDKISERTIKQTKCKPVLINYSVGKKRYERKPNISDIHILERIDSQIDQVLQFIPNIPIQEGDKTGEPRRMGYDRIYHLYTTRNYYALAKILSRIKFENRIGLLFTSIILNSSRLYRWRTNGKGGYLNGTLYIASLTQENNVLKLFREKIRDLRFKITQSNVSQVGSADQIMVNSNSFDYIFTDPPFGANLMYSELNLLIEGWLKILTNNRREAIENKTQRKSTLDYQNIMTDCFIEYYRLLKDGKWMTVEFSNTSAAVWNGIQTALQKAGFIIANVASIDKKQGSYNAVTNATSVKQDLVISCYKPTSEFESRFKTQQSEISVWDFVSQHLNHLPVHIKRDNSTTAIIERSPKILYDRLITFYLMRGFPVPVDARDFQDGMRQRYVERDGMYFTSEQAAEYDEKKAKAPQFVQLSLIVTNESDAIEWLKDRLRKQAQKYQDIMPDFRIATQSLRKGDTLPELQDILNENFIQESDGRWRTPDPNEEKDRIELRTKVLLKEFNGYVTAISQPRAKKLKEVRVEALRVGFKHCWEQKEFNTIVIMGDMIPQNILLEDEQLLMYYDVAKDRV